MKKDTCSPVTVFIKETLYSVMIPFCSDRGGGFHSNNTPVELSTVILKSVGELDGTI